MRSAGRLSSASVGAHGASRRATEHFASVFGRPSRPARTLNLTRAPRWRCPMFDPPCCGKDPGVPSLPGCGPSRRRLYRCRPGIPRIDAGLRQECIGLNRGPTGRSEAVPRWSRCRVRLRGIGVVGRSNNLGCVALGRPRTSGSAHASGGGPPTHEARLSPPRGVRRSRCRNSTGSGDPPGRPVRADDDGV